MCRNVTLWHRSILWKLQSHRRSQAGQPPGLLHSTEFGDRSETNATGGGSADFRSPSHHHHMSHHRVNDVTITAWQEESSVLDESATCCSSLCREPSSLVHLCIRRRSAAWTLVQSAKRSCLTDAVAVLLDRQTSSGGWATKSGLPQPTFIGPYGKVPITPKVSTSSH